MGHTWGSSLLTRWCPKASCSLSSCSGTALPCSPEGLCCVRGTSVGTPWVGRLAGACRGMALVPWPGYPAIQNKEGGFPKDSPHPGRENFQKTFLWLDGCWRDRKAGGRGVMQQFAGTAKSRVPPQWIWAVPKSDGQWSFWLSPSCGIAF